MTVLVTTQTIRAACSQGQRGVWNERGNDLFVAVEELVAASLIGILPPLGEFDLTDTGSGSSIGGMACAPKQAAGGEHDTFVEWNGSGHGEPGKD